jgi:hypothetical protein
MKIEIKSETSKVTRPLKRAIATIGSIFVVITLLDEWS